MQYFCGGQKIPLPAIVTTFESIDYLSIGSPRQQHAYHTLKKHQVLAQLQPFDPLLVGTIPIEIDIENSDLDIICHCEDLGGFMDAVREKFGDAEGFTISKIDAGAALAVIANFQLDNFDIEIFGQNTPTRQQNAYRHMLVEHRLLQQHGEPFRQKIIELKRQGYKTEPAFALLLGLEGDPYQGLLDLDGGFPP